MRSCRPPTPPELARRTATPTATDALRTDAFPTGARTGARRRADAGNVVDVAFVYPAAPVSQADIGGLAGLRAKFAAQIADANTAFANSGIRVQLRCVGDRQVASATSTDLFAMLRQLSKPGDGIYDEAQAVREETHADLVSLWASGSVPLGASCGVGALGGLTPEYDPEVAAWTVLFYTDCIDDYRVFAHEIGHNFSGDHDAGAASAPLPEGKPYARGYTDPAHGFVTVMAYYEACRNVGVTCTARPTSRAPTCGPPRATPTGSAAADNVRAITEQAPAVANYRQSQIYSAAPTITGKPNRGQRLTASTAGWAPGNVTFSYQWLADGAPIAGATGSTFVLGKAQVGSSITVTVTGGAPYYESVAATSAATGAVGKRLFAKTHRPTIKGAARAGASLRAVVRDWKPKRKVTYTFKWFRNGKAIKGAKGRTYRVSRKDRGKKLWVRVTGRRNGYESVSRVSKKLKVRR
ncbi:reprolysin-like metallopeptidase [Nocardioides sp. B-3]|uniref:reprolysin-like metallopeptidase n=1 Tax=Nocardioides sp. B-3 TaxID=2895565 RepID=UPI002153240B|nr:M12 family metallo-peptidase [Nocardioides sp. B-3]UUZ60357.1 M12 family metallo-peptidase [Nocardioides sp. B-3]